jgi:hypothetical protein
VAVKPGDDIYLHTGVYKGSFTSRLKGTAAAPITVRPFHGEQATIECYSANPNEDPLFTVEGQYTIFRGFEVTCRNPLRTTQIQGSSPEQIKRGGISCRGTGISFINLIVHDCANGLGFWADGEGGEIYGCVIYNNGWIGPDRGHGHGIYTQNKAGTKVLADNVIFNQFSHGIHAYGSAQAFLQGFQIEGNVCFNNGLPAGAIAPDILIGGECPAREIALLNNFTYNARGSSPVRLGYAAVNEDITATNNYFHGGVQVKLWKNFAFAANTLIAPASLISLEIPPDALRTGLNLNTYCSADLKPFTITKDGKTTAFNWDEWRKKNPFDKDSHFLLGKPTGVHVFFRPNKYEDGRAHIIVYNWDQKQSVSVDLNAALQKGMNYKIVSAQDPFGQPLLTGTWEGQPVEIPLKPVPATQPIGLPDFHAPVTEPTFAVFLLLPVW